MHLVVPFPEFVPLVVPANSVFTNSPPGQASPNAVFSPNGHISCISYIAVHPNGLLYGPVGHYVQMHPNGMLPSSGTSAHRVAGWMHASGMAM